MPLLRSYLGLEVFLLLVVTQVLCFQDEVSLLPVLDDGALLFQPTSFQRPLQRVGGMGPMEGPLWVDRHHAVGTNWGEERKVVREKHRPGRAREKANIWEENPTKPRCGESDPSPPHPNLSNPTVVTVKQKAKKEKSASRARSLWQRERKLLQLFVRMDFLFPAWALFFTNEKGSPKCSQKGHQLIVTLPKNTTELRVNLNLNRGWDQNMGFLDHP